MTAVQCSPRSGDGVRMYRSSLEVVVWADYKPEIALGVIDAHDIDISSV